VGRDTLLLASRPGEVAATAVEGDALPPAAAAVGMGMTTLSSWCCCCCCCWDG
jgi:hypothetical protein